LHQEHKTILIVDDEPLNIEIICDYLECSDTEYQWDTAKDGSEAWKMLEDSPDKYSVVLLDRMMPIMNGLEVLSRMKQHPTLKEIPVILQTALASKTEIIEGIEAGAYYYLSKPFSEESLISIVRTAYCDFTRYLSVKHDLEANKLALGLMTSSRFQFKSIDEARELAFVIAQACPDPEMVVTGLSELLINAVEHGNLEIGYAEKTRLNESAQWENEVKRRLTLDQYINKNVDVEFERSDKDIKVTIRDQGHGFDCNPYLEISAERGADNHGRGIALARMLSFSALEYKGSGNVVVATIQI